jgi:hypothetical protein
MVEWRPKHTGANKWERKDILFGLFFDSNNACLFAAFWWQPCAWWPARPSLMMKIGSSPLPLPRKPRQPLYRGCIRRTRTSARCARVWSPITVAHRRRILPRLTALPCPPGRWRLTESLQVTDVGPKTHISVTSVTVCVSWRDSPPMSLCSMTELYVVSELMLTPYIPVRFSGLSDQQFRGLYVQARNEQNVPVGSFQPSDDEHVRLSSCGNGRDVSDPLPCNCLKHSGNYIYHPLQHVRALRSAHSTFLCFLWFSHCSVFFNKTDRLVLLIET